jgi:capsular polysaccharide biosynthesis protein
VSALRQKIRAAARKNPAVHAVGSKVLRVVRRHQRDRSQRSAGGPLGEYTSLLPRGSERRIVVLADGRRRPRAQQWLVGFHRDRIHLISPADSPALTKSRIGFERHAAGSVREYAEVLDTIGPVDVVIDLLPGTVEQHLKIWEALFYNLKPGGVYAVDYKFVDPAGRTAATLGWVRRVTTEGDEAANRGDRAKADATASVVRSRDLLLIKKRHRHYLKLRDADVTRLLAAREPSMRVTEFATRPAGQFVSRAELVSHEASVPIPWPPEPITYPPMHLRHVRGRTAFLGSSLVHTETCILPESFRWHLEPNPRNPKIKSDSPDFARIPPELRPKQTLDGNYFLMDPNGVGHFGHFLTESIGRLWGWDEAKRRIPDLKAIYRIRDISTVNDRFERKLMMAYGIDAEDIVAVDRSVYLDSLVTATTMWHNSSPYYVHPDLTSVWDRISRNLVDPAAPTYERVFISRSGKWWRRVCRNLPEVEDLFKAHGFTIIYPEHLDLAAQAAVFATTPVIAGFGGSAMFNVMHAKNLKAMILLGHEAYTARNEFLYGSLIGGPTHYFWSKPDTPHPVGGWSQAAFDSNWEFDFARNQKPLEELLDSL